MTPFSIITAIYKNDKPEYVRIALDSMLVNQTVKPTEIVLIRDGPVSQELELLVNEYEFQYPSIMHVIRLKQNKGLGNALMLGTEASKHEIVARMDSDDICLPKRFEVQLKCLESLPEIDVVGGQMTEFIGDPENIVGCREVPLENAAIYEFMKSRCALNHVTVMFRKSSVLNAGNYQDWFWNEDYYLWIRMMQLGCKFANLNDVLVNVRVGKEMYARRGGKKYFKSEIKLQKYMLQNKLIGLPRYCYNVLVRFAVQRAMPNWMRAIVFQKLFRRK